MAFLVAFGSLLPGHVAQGWKLGRNVGMGAALLTAALLLGASGWGLYYAGGETLREWLSTGHWAVGLGTGPLLALHVFVGRRTALWK